MTFLFFAFFCMSIAPRNHHQTLWSIPPNLEDNSSTLKICDPSLAVHYISIHYFHFFRIRDRFGCRAWFIKSCLLWLPLWLWIPLLPLGTAVEWMLWGIRERWDGWYNKTKPKIHLFLLSFTFYSLNIPILLDAS